MEYGKCTHLLAGATQYPFLLIRTFRHRTQNTRVGCRKINYATKSNIKTYNLVDITDVNHVFSY